MATDPKKVLRFSPQEGVKVFTQAGGAWGKET
jgi:hypothetical protein